MISRDILFDLISELPVFELYCDKFSQLKKMLHRFEILYPVFSTQHNLYLF